jgi:hypothetical protein
MNVYFDSLFQEDIVKDQLQDALKELKKRTCNEDRNEIIVSKNE